MTRKTSDKRDGGEDRVHVGWRERLAARARADAADVAAARFDPHEVVAELIELVANHGRAAFTERDRRDDSADPDRDSQRGQDRPQTVPPQRDERDAKGGQNHRGTGL